MRHLRGNRSAKWLFRCASNPVEWFSVDNWFVDVILYRVENEEIQVKNEIEIKSDSENRPSNWMGDGSHDARSPIN